jgi:hypothetical protein
LGWRDSPGAQPPFGRLAGWGVRGCAAGGAGGVGGVVGGWGSPGVASLGLGWLGWVRLPWGLVVRGAGCRVVAVERVFG